MSVSDDSRNLQLLDSSVGTAEGAAAGMRLRIQHRVRQFDRHHH